MPDCELLNKPVGETTLLVWDTSGLPLPGVWSVVLWRGFGDDTTPGAISIPSLVEEHAEELRARYLGWIYELGELQIEGRRVVDYLGLRPGFSAWWMSLLVEKCNWAKSPQIYDAIRLMAFANWANGKSFDRVVFASSNRLLAECIRSWCERLGVSFEWRRMLDEADSPPWTKRLYQFLPYSLQALTFLLHYLVSRWPLRGIGLSEWRTTNGELCFVSYLDNLIPEEVKKGRFASHYWAHFPEELLVENCKTNWLHLYVKDTLLPTSRVAAKVINRFNDLSQGKQSHVTLDTFLNLRSIFGAVYDWLRLVMVSRRLHFGATAPRVGELDLWPLFEEDWRCSTSGKTAMGNVIFLNLFESALKYLPKQRVGVYLQENQGWESSFIHAWRERKHGALFGSPHSTVRFWDLRYFYDARSYCREGENVLPLPDRVALNGAVAIDVYRKGGYPEEGVVEVEALRYFHLAETVADKRVILVSSLQKSFRVLVLGDYLLSNTLLQLRLLQKAAKSLPEKMIFMAKAHPNCPIQPSYYSGLEMEVTTEPLPKLLAECDLAYTSSVTSAAVDAYCAGLPVVSVLDQNNLNLSPLRGRVGVLFASTPEDLARMLIESVTIPSIVCTRQDFFTLDPKLPHWRKLLLEPSVR